jgi:hypothetical protein
VGRTVLSTSLCRWPSSAIRWLLLSPPVCCQRARPQTQQNEITNLEMKMIGLQLARSIGDAASKKEIIKSFANTERNFILKKNEKSISTEATSEYNDMKSTIEKLASKIPGRS